MGNASIMRFKSTDTTGAVQAKIRYTGCTVTQAKIIFNQKVKQYSHLKGRFGSFNNLIRF
jgi:hypothetical protein